MPPVKSPSFSTNHIQKAALLLFLSVLAITAVATRATNMESSDEPTLMVTLLWRCKA